MVKTRWRGVDRADRCGVEREECCGEIIEDRSGKKYISLKQVK